MQVVFEDSFITDAYSLQELDFHIVMLSDPPMPESVGTLVAKYVKYLNQTEEIIDIEMNPCTDYPENARRLKSFMEPRYEEDFSKAFNNTRCVEDPRIHIQGGQNSRDTQYFTIEFVKCEDEDDSDRCDSYEEMLEYFENSVQTVIYMKSQVDMKN